MSIFICRAPLSPQKWRQSPHEGSIIRYYATSRKVLIQKSTICSQMKALKILLRKIALFCSVEPPPHKKNGCKYFGVRKRSNLIVFRVEKWRVITFFVQIRNFFVLPYAFGTREIEVIRFVKMLTP